MNIKNKLEEIDKYFYEKKFLKVIKKTTELLEIDNNCFNGYELRGGAYLLLGYHEKALSDFNNAEKIKPNQSHIYSNQSTCHLFNNDFETALEYINRAIDVKPDTHYFINRGNIYEMLKYFKLATIDYQKVLDEKIKATINEPIISNSLARTLFNSNKETKAMNYINETIKKFPKEAILYSSRGLMKSSQGEEENAKLDYIKAIKLNPFNPEFRKILARSHYELNEGFSSVLQNLIGDHLKENHLN